jgi:hypothetical protein
MTVRETVSRPGIGDVLKLVKVFREEPHARSLRRRVLEYREKARNGDRLWGLQYCD